MGINLRVSTEALKTKAREVDTEIQKLEKYINQIQDIVSRTTSYWTGMSGDKARKEFLGQQENMNLVLRRFREHPDDLLKMAGIYEAGEQQVRQSNEALKTNIIV